MSVSSEHLLRLAKVSTLNKKSETSSFPSYEIFHLSTFTVVLGARESVRELFQLSLKERSLLDEGSLLPPLRFSLPPERFLLALGHSARFILKQKIHLRKHFLNGK